MKCRFCNKEALFILENKTPCCSSNIAKCKTIRNKISQRAKGRPSKRKGEKGWPCPFKNMTYDQYFGEEKAKEIRQKMSKAQTGNSGLAATEELENLRRSKISKTLKLKKLGGYRIGSGRCKGQWYDSKFAGHIYLNGSYELAYAKYLDSQNINWARPKDGIKYYFNEAEHLYYPDFYLSSTDEYIEIKNFVTDKDKAKWGQFPYKLKVLFRKDLQSLGLNV